MSDVVLRFSVDTPQVAQMFGRFLTSFIESRTQVGILFERIDQQLDVIFSVNIVTVPGRKIIAFGFFHDFIGRLQKGLSALGNNCHPAVPAEFSHRISNFFRAITQDLYIQ